jgi:hypothetical protein
VKRLKTVQTFSPAGLTYEEIRVNLIVTLLH